MKPMFTKESLELLRQRIDLIDVLSPYVPLQRSGAAYKALCPFHEEKTPSFTIQRGDTHYHCFGCGAHGDAIAFLMTHVRMGFKESVEYLSEKFQVPLERAERTSQEVGPSRNVVRRALEEASQLYHYLLLHSEEGQVALRYLYARGLDLEFIRKFEIGFASKTAGVMTSYLKAKNLDDEVLEAAGLIATTQTGRKREFFSDRITFPIRDATGHVIGFSARKFKEETFGGKYVNTPETILFKKSRVLFGLSYSRVRIAKEAQAIIVEGQIDALRLIHTGFDYTVAGQGTAFGEEHVRELVQLGVKRVFLALDGDLAGREATVKIGHLFQKKGVEVLVVALPQGSDPDLLLRQEGPEAFSALLKQGTDYLPFLFSHLSKGETSLSAARKNEIVTAMAERIKQWEMPVMVHESLKTLATIANIPEMMLDVPSFAPVELRLKKRATLPVHSIDPHRILEADLLRWLLVAAPQCPEIVAMVSKNLSAEMFLFAPAKRIYEHIMACHGEGKSWDLLALGGDLEEESQQFLAEIMQRKVNLSKAVEGCHETLRKMLHRSWELKKQAIHQELASQTLSDEEALTRLKEFDLLKTPPEVIRP